MTTQSPHRVAVLGGILQRRHRTVLLAGAQRFGQRVEVHDRAAADVDEPRGLLHPAKRIESDRTLRRGCVWRGDHDVITGREQCVGTVIPPSSGGIITMLALLMLLFARRLTLFSFVRVFRK